MTHDYISTACQHGLGEGRDEPSMCRFLCKFCRVQCACHCHGESPAPYEGYDPEQEARLRVAVRTALTERGLPPGARGVELLTDIVITSVENLAKGAATP